MEDINYEIDDNFEEIILFLTNFKNIVKNAANMAEDLFHNEDLYLPAITFEDFWVKIEECGYLKDNIYKYISAVSLFLIKELYKGRLENAIHIYIKFVPLYEVLMEFSNNELLHTPDFRKMVTYFIKEVLKVIGFVNTQTYPEKVLILQLARYMATELGKVKHFGLVVIDEIHSKLKTMLAYFKEDKKFELDGVQANCLLQYLTILKDILQNMSNNSQGEFESINFDDLKTDLDEVKKVIKSTVPTFVVSLIYEIFSFL